jgi:Mg2+ and Co2+ transporter CorA
VSDRSANICESRLCYLIDRFEEPQTGHRSRTILDVFEISIETVAGETSEYIALVGIESIDIKTENNLLHRISNIREELTMIRRVLIQQEEVWRDFASQVWPDHWSNYRDGQVNYPDEFKKRTAEEKAVWKKQMRLLMHPQSQLQRFQQ